MNKPLPLSLDQIKTPKESNLWDWIALLLKRRLRFNVHGNSMLPLLYNGDDIFVYPKRFEKKELKIGDLIVIRHPYRTDLILIKYVASIQEQGDVYVLGINLKESTDSRSFGWIPPSLIYGCIQSRFKSNQIN
jgi:nickel-type superoxide dismutase maturation protease